MKKLTLRKIIMGLALGGILFDVAFDLVSYQHIKASDKTGHQVVRSYEILLQLQKVDRALAQIFVPPVRENELANVKNQVNQLGVLLESRPEQEALFARIEELIQPLSLASPADRERVEKSAEQAIDLVSRMLVQESRSLKPQLNEDITENHKIEYSSTGALILDAFLGLMVFGLFLLDHRLRKKVEENLAGSLSDMMNINQNLEEERVRRQISLRTIVHDLKSPLGTIQGFAELMGEDRTALTAQEFSERIKKISEKSLVLVESLLSAAPESQPTPLDLMPILRDSVRHFEAMALLKNQSLRTDFRVRAATILGIKLRLEELFSNLIGNAIKYSPYGKNIWIRCFEFENHFRVEVEDQGPGFDEEDRQKAFRYGQSLKAKPTGGETSSGLGLFIVKQIVDTHEARIAIEDAVSGTGARIVVDFPIHREPV